MGRNRYNKPQGEPIDYSPKKKVVDEPTLSFSPCMICHKAIKQGYYGTFEIGGTCSLHCNTLYEESRPKMIDYVILKSDKND